MKSYVQLPSPPSSPSTASNSSFPFTEERNEFMEIIGEDKKSNSNNNNNNNNDIGTPEEIHIEIDREDILRNKFIDIMEEGIQIKDKMISYDYFIQNLHRVGGKIINKKTKDAILLRVYEIGNDNFQEFWVHPMYLSLQSFQFFKLFDEGNCNNENGIIEIEVPSLETFPLILYWLYTGNQDKVLEIGKLDETLCNGIMDNILYLDINIPTF